MKITNVERNKRIKDAKYQLENLEEGKSLTIIYEENIIMTYTKDNNKYNLDGENYRFTDVKGILNNCNLVYGYITDIT